MRSSQKIKNFMPFVLAILALLPGANGVEIADQTTLVKDLSYITEQFPPYNFLEDGELKGISVDLLETIWKMLGADINRSVIVTLPWTEGYQRALDEEGVVLFSMARLPQREQLFKWAGPIGPIRTVLLVKNDTSISITATEDLKNYRIGAIKDDYSVQMLLDNDLAIENLTLEATAAQIIEMLQNGSIDAWAYDDMAGILLIQESGKNASDFRTAYVLGELDFYYAFNKETPDSLVQSFQDAIDHIKSNKDANGVSDYEVILSRYIPVT